LGELERDKGSCGGNGFGVGILRLYGLIATLTNPTFGLWLWGGLSGFFHFRAKPEPPKAELFQGLQK
jgi:hypothetical protein